MNQGVDGTIKRVISDPEQEFWRKSQRTGSPSDNDYMGNNRNKQSNNDTNKHDGFFVGDIAAGAATNLDRLSSSPQPPLAYMRAAGVAAGASAAAAAARSMDGDSSTNNKSNNHNNSNHNNIASPAVVVEDDDDDEDGGDDFDFMVPIDREESYPPTRPLSHIHQATSRTSTTSSSLSDDRSQNALMMDAMSFRNLPPTHPHPTMAGTMNAAMIRNDSRLSNDSSTMLRSTENSSGNYWGWFEDVHVGPESSSMGDLRRNTTRRERSRGGQLSNEGSMSPAGDSGIDLGSGEAFVVTAPTYVLEESLSSQQLWRHTAGNRPPQPDEERAFFEQMWAQNFVRSQVDYHMPVEVLTATTPISLSPFADGNFAPAQEDYGVYADIDQSPNRREEVALMRRLHDPRQAHSNIGIRSIAAHRKQHIVNKKVKKAGSDSSMTVLVRGDNVFGTTVAKSFPRKVEKSAPLEGVNTVNISIASYRVVETKKHGKYAQYLVIYREGNIRDTIGVWKRYSDFVELSRKVLEANISCVSVLASMSPMSVSKEPDAEHLPNAITSWKVLKRRQRWYRCLDSGYLSVKVFMLERFLHDILYESSSPRMLRDFVGVVGTAAATAGATTTTPGAPAAAVGTEGSTTSDT